MALVVGLLAGCASQAYRPPSLDEPHALVKLRLVYHQRGDAELEQRVTIGGASLGDIPAPGARDGAVATRTVPVPPGRVDLTVEATFFHNNVTSNAETYETTASAPCGSSDCTQIQPHTRLVNHVERVNDATCAQGLRFDAEVGSAYLLDYEYFANQRCSLTCFRHVPGHGGRSTKVPCTNSPPLTKAP